jgi:hypothetical protein
MSVVHANQDAAAKWLMERRDLAERRETIGMIMNAALLVFIAWTILLGVINLFRAAHLAALPKMAGQVRAWPRVQGHVLQRRAVAPRVMLGPFVHSQLA